MSYHKTNLGGFAAHVERYADIDGYVPEHGDDWRDMRYDLGPDDPEEEGISEEERQARQQHLDEDWWPDKVAEAASATDEANRAVANWQKQNP
jgi:hypothetical protein